MILDKILIITGILLFVLFLLFFFRRWIRLTLLKLVYGEYSFEFISTYKSYYIKSPFQYCFKDEFLTHILYVLTKKEDIPTFKSQQDINFEGTPYFINYKSFLKKKGNPYCFNAYYFDNVGFEIQALGYRSTIAGSKAVIIYYFMNDSFFMGEYIFKNPKTNIKNTLAEQYLEKRELTEDNFYIENTKNRIIHFHNTGFTVDIKFLNREDPNIINNLTEYFSFFSGKKR